MITREQVADLRPGDVLNLRWDAHPGVVVTGPLRPRGGGQWIGPVRVIAPSGEVHDGLDITVVSRAPRPLYVNHSRTEPIGGDLVTEDVPGGRGLWFFVRLNPEVRWVDAAGRTKRRDELPDRLRLLVDGETGRCVP